MAAPMKCNMKKYVLHFAHEHTDFRIAELKSLLKLFKINTDVECNSIDSPYLIVQLPSVECARQVASRAILVKSVIELWAHAQTYEELAQTLLQKPETNLDAYIQSKDSFKFEVNTFNKKLKQKEKIERIERLADAGVAFEGRVDLKSPCHRYEILEYYGQFGTQSSEEPLDIYLGRWIADGQRDKINEFHLQKRHFIANTSMDAGLSMIMTNLGLVNKHMLVLDPFVGSGSLLLTAAAQGAYVMGTDIDYLLLHGKARPSRCNMKQRAPDEGVASNLAQYGLAHLYIDALIADASRHNMWRDQTLFDAIITDPPYGIRESALTVGSKKSEDVTIDEELKTSGKHIAQKKQYEMSAIFLDLLNFAARYLHVDGRLVYWFPVARDTYREENIPRHRCLELVHNCEQVLNTRMARRLVTMVKHRECTPDDRAYVAQDHFEEASFRDMYFSENTRTKEHATKYRGQSPSQADKT